MERDSRRRSHYTGAAKVERKKDAPRSSAFPRRKMSSHLPRRSGPAWIAGLALAGLSACATPAKEAPTPQPVAIDSNADRPDAPVPIGKLMVDIDASMRAWTKLVLSANTAEEKRQARMLELDLRRRVRPRTAELIHELESGPPTNRTTAAAALGFTQSPEAQSPLLAALSDKDPDVVNNALIGLAILQLGDTPLGPIIELFETSPDPQVRSNAAYALRSLMEAGAPSEQVRESARRALEDSEPFVRMQAALILAMMVDGESTEKIGELTGDSAALVRRAACEALARIGLDDPHSKGQAARALARALQAAPEEQRAVPHRALVNLTGGQDFGDDPKEWLEWAYKLP